MVDKKPPPPGSLVNLRQARKQRERAARTAQADENRTRHGQSKADKSLSAARREKSGRDLDGARRARDPDQDGADSDS